MARPSIRYGYAGIRVTDLDRSLRFYRGLGFRIHKRGEMEHGGRWVHLRMPGSSQKLELNYYPAGSRFDEPYRPGSELDHLGFFVGDLRTWVARAHRLGAKDAARVQEEHENIAYVTDPDGVWIEFCGPPEPPTKR
jgi:catechol 2,3-dioxygenase-like lactoylglutathione lyase family enzyme